MRSSWRELGMIPANPSGCGSASLSGVSRADRAKRRPPFSAPTRLMIDASQSCRPSCHERCPNTKADNDRQARQSTTVLFRNQSPVEREKSEAAAAIVSHIAATPEFRNARIVFSYLALASEPDLSPLVEQHPEKVWVFSRVRSDGERLAFHEVTASDQLREGNFGFLEPDPEECPKRTTPDLVSCLELDLILPSERVSAAEKATTTAFLNRTRERFLHSAFAFESRSWNSTPSHTTSP